MIPEPFHRKAIVRRILSAGLILLAAALPLSAQGAEEASFVIRMGADTFAVESFSRTPDRLEGELSGRTLGRMIYSVSLGPAATTPDLTLRAWMPGSAPDAPPGQEANITLRGDSAIAEITTPAGTQTQRLGARTGALVYLNPSFALMEQVVLRARELGGERVEVPLFFVQGGQTIPATITRVGADSVVIALAGSEMRARVSAEGRLLSGGVHAQNLSFTRQAGALPSTAVFERPDYSALPDAPYTAEEVAVPTPAGHTLAGTLTRPRTRGRVPAVVLITGSGPQERDEALPMLRGYRPFRQIADTLSRRGIAVLRLDDRGVGGSTGDFAAATSADFADDIRAALAYLRGRADIDGRRLGLIGHSEGGMIAPMVAATDPALRGIVLIAGPAQTGREIIAYQQRYAIEASPTLPEASRDSAFAAAQAQLEELAARQPWMQFFLDYDPLPTARQVRSPVLILQGATDRQVTAEQAEALAAAFRTGSNQRVTVRVFPEVNHLLLHDPDGNPAGYVTLQDRQVVPEVLGAIADWVVAQLR